MAATETLMVVSALETPRVGDVFESLPSHVTFMPWFDHPISKWDDFDGYMHDVIEQSSQPTVVIGDQGFDDEPDASVRRLNRISPSFNLIKGFPIHAGIWQAAHVHGTGIDATYAGMNWKPHISEKPGLELAEGQELTLTNLTVFRRDELRRKLVRAVYTWDRAA